MPIPILRTKLHRPSLAPDLVSRKALHDRLDANLHLPLTLVSGPAGYGKSTLVSHWLDQSDHLAAWVSLDEGDNDLRIFLAYIVAALESTFPENTFETRGFLRVGELPPVSVLADFLINDLDAIKQPVILVLDDYYRIGSTTVHDLLERVLDHPPHSIHIVIVTRYNPPLHIASLRAKSLLSEVTMEDLKFTQSETATYLSHCLNPQLDADMVETLQRRTEGWPVGLRLAVLAMQKHGDPEAFIQNFGGRSRHIEDYLVSEILSRESTPIRDWLIKTAILERFNASLCETVCSTGEGSKAHRSQPLSGSGFIKILHDRGLFCIALDESGRWYRYHHLFKDLLQRQLKIHKNEAEITELHKLAAGWFEANQLIEEALSHTFALDDPQASGNLIIRNRHQITQKEQWHRLNHLLSLLSPEVANRTPELQILKAWSYDSRGRIAEEHQVLDRVEPMVNNLTPNGYREQLLGEIDTLRSMQNYEYAADGQVALRLSSRALERLPAELVSERAHATIIKAVSLQMIGDLNDALKIINIAMQDKTQANTTHHGRMLMTRCFLHWMAANLIELKRNATTMLKVGEANNLQETKAYASYFLGICHYQTNELAKAQEFLDPVVSERSISNMTSYVRCSHALSLAFQSKGDAHKANKVAESTMDRLLKTANTFYLPLMEAFLAELALRQGRLAEAVQWVDGFEAAMPQQAYGCFVPELTAVKIRLHQSTPESLRHAESMLDCLLPFFQSNHNIRWTIEVLALQALLHTLNGDESAALSILQRAMALAQPGGFIRLFVDLGPELARLIHRLKLDDAGLNYAGQIMAAYKVNGTNPKASSSQRSVSPLPKPLTPRELEILSMLATSLSSREIAKKLFISAGTVKVHTNKIYRKLGVNSRNNAVAKAAGLGIEL